MSRIMTQFLAHANTNVFESLRFSTTAKHSDSPHTPCTLSQTQELQFRHVQNPNGSHHFSLHVQCPPPQSQSPFGYHLESLALFAPSRTTQPSWYSALHYQSGNPLRSCRGPNPAYCRDRAPTPAGNCLRYATAQSLQ